MNDEAALPGRPATTSIAPSEGTTGRRRVPELHLVVALEELPVVRVVADSLEDELRLRRWLRSQAARRRLFDALLDGLDEFAA